MAWLKMPRGNSLPSLLHSSDRSGFQELAQSPTRPRQHLHQHRLSLAWLPRWRVPKLLRTRLFWLVTSLVLFFPAISILSGFQQLDSSQYGMHLRDSLTLDADSIPPGRRKLVIVMPVDSPGHDLCKVISSAVALGYPPPVLVNWNKDFHTDEAGIGPSHLAKVSGTLEFLDWATRNETDEADRLEDDDLVLMMDALDIWFQLPPDILLERYYRIVQNAGERLAHSSGIYDPEWTRQTTIGAAQKGCMGPRDDFSNLHCDELPESTLPQNVYGFWTDSGVWGWKWNRPRYVNSGSFIGPVAEMRRYFERVKAKMDGHAMMGQELGGDQGVFSEVFGEQEVWRRRVAAEHEAGEARGADNQAAALRETFDYHLTLDYTQELFYPTGYSENDGGFRVLDDEASPAAGGLAGMASDIDGARNPLSALDGIPDGDRGLGLGNMSLFVDFWTGSVPVAIHHNAWRNGLKSRRETWWDQMWFFPYLRRLLAASSDPARETVPLLTLPACNGTLEVWPYGVGKPRLSAFILEDKAKGGEAKGEKPKAGGRSRELVLSAAGWERTCKGEDAVAEAERRWFDELFRDEKGPLKAPG